MSVVSSLIKKVKKSKITRGIGKIVDVASDFLPPGLRDVGNLTGKLLQQQNLKKAALGTAMDYGAGKIGGMVAGKLGGAAKGAAGKAIPNVDTSAMPAAANVIGNRAGAAATGIGGFSGGVVGGMPVLLPQAAKAAGGGVAQNAVKSIAQNFGGQVVKNLTGSPTGPANSGGGGWLDKPGMIEGLFGLAGGALSGYGQGQMADKDRAWDKEKFGREMVIPEGEAAMGAQRSMEMSPMRDKALYLLTQRMGMQPQSFVPHDIYNPSYGSGAPQLGGYDQNKLNAQNEAYKPGMGGTNTDIQKMLLQKLGYGTQPVRK